MVRPTRSTSPTFCTSSRSWASSCVSIWSSTSAPASVSLVGSIRGSPPTPRSIVGVRRTPPLSDEARSRASRSSSTFL
jgi:hypothetical protein